MNLKHPEIQRYQPTAVQERTPWGAEVVLRKSEKGEVVLFDDLTPLLHELEGLRDREVVLELELKIASRRNSILIEKLANKE